MSQLQAMTRAVEEGVILLREGTEGGDLIILVDGALGLYADGRRMAVIDQPGSYVGSTEALLHGKRGTTVKTEARCQVIRIPRDQVQSFFRHSPDMGLKLARQLARRLKDTTATLAESRQNSSELRDGMSDVLESLDDIRDIARQKPDPAEFRVAVLTLLKRLQRRFDDSGFTDETVIF